MQPKQTPCHEAHGFDVHLGVLKAFDELPEVCHGAVAMGGNCADAIRVVEDAGHIPVGQTCFATVLHNDVQ